jgi:hypothetical protein
MRTRTRQTARTLPNFREAVKAEGRRSTSGVSPMGSQRKRREGPSGPPVQNGGTLQEPGRPRGTSCKSDSRHTNRTTDDLRRALEDAEASRRPAPAGPGRCADRSASSAPASVFSSGRSRSRRMFKGCSSTISIQQVFEILAGGGGDNREAPLNQPHAPSVPFGGVPEHPRPLWGVRSLRDPSPLLGWQAIPIAGQLQQGQRPAFAWDGVVQRWSMGLATHVMGPDGAKWVSCVSFLSNSFQIHHDLISDDMTHNGETAKMDGGPGALLLLDR